MADAQQQSSSTLSQPQAAASNETAGQAMAAQAQASIQVRYLKAIQQPRILDQVRVSLLAECKRPRFAEVARYHKPIGKGVEGPSIRFVEAALRCYRNILQETPTVYDDTSKRIIRVIVTDLETNMTFSKDVTVSKTVEKTNRSLKPGTPYISSRVNSYGGTTYLVEATDDEILNKEGALVSKAIRTLGLRLIPGDLVEEAMDQVEATSRDATAKDPDAEKKKLIDSFHAVGVQPSDLVAYLDHELGRITPAEITRLRKIYVAVRDGETTWNEVVAAQEEEVDEKAQPAKPAPSPVSDPTPAPSEPAEKVAVAPEPVPDVKAALAAKKKASRTEEPDPWKNEKYQGDA